VARVNYQREKRLKDLDRQKKQEEKRNRRLLKGETPVEGGAPVEGAEGSLVAPEGADPAQEPGTAAEGI
jgi:hypothetical protein